MNIDSNNGYNRANADVLFGLPKIIQGGMGISISNWRLANAVSTNGQLGVVSGTAIEAVHVRILSTGDPDGVLTEAYSHFPDQDLVARVMSKYFNKDGKESTKRYHSIPMFKMQPSKNLLEIIILANFAEVWLAKKGHNGPVGVNYLQKIEVPTPSAIFGAMLGGVDVVLMGAGIPSHIPQLLNDLSEFKKVTYPVKVVNSPPDGNSKTEFDPTHIVDVQKIKSHFDIEKLRRPVFLAIVSSDVLAYFLAKSEKTKPDGFIIEGPTAGGHNAPPRGKLTLDLTGQPIYGTRDEVNFAKLVELNIPFWLAGSFGSPDKLQHAVSLGARGIQVGSLFAVCKESGMESNLKSQLLDYSINDKLEVRTEPYASPSGYPFKVASLDNTLSESTVVENRQRRCDLGYLREAVYIEEQGIKFRCPAEPVSHYLAKGGKLEETENRLCLCNGLMSTAGFGQVRSDENKNYKEPPVVTIGDDIKASAKEMLKFVNSNRPISDLTSSDITVQPDQDSESISFSAAQVIDYLLSGLK
jgi:NAD(P)H-dependent flavin oxidoreductase YrpB (nitropropane dioxygenase family)